MNDDVATVEPFPTLLPENRIQYESRIKFKPGPGAEALLKRLLANRQMQTIWQSPITGEKLVCWPFDEEFAILQVTDTCSTINEPPMVFQRHKNSASAQLRVLAMLNGFSEFVQPQHFKETAANPDERA